MWIKKFRSGRVDKRNVGVSGTKTNEDYCCPKIFSLQKNLMIITNSIQTVGYSVRETIILLHHECWMEAKWLQDKSLVNVLINILDSLSCPEWLRIHTGHFFPYYSNLYESCKIIPIPQKGIKPYFNGALVMRSEHFTHKLTFQHKGQAHITVISTLQAGIKINICHLKNKFK